MKTLDIHLIEKEKKYPIIVGENTIIKINEVIEKNNYSNIFIVTDTIIQKIWLKKLQQVLQVENGLKPLQSIVIPAGEQHKTINTVTTIWKQLHEFGADRNSLVINFGGGVIGDMGGFAASTYMRGIDVIQIPTTLLSAIDASVGGKTGIDFDNIKNLIGTFNQPKAVIIDTNFFDTLPHREYLNGFAEIIKHGLIQDKSYFAFVTSKKPCEFTKNELVEIIVRSCEIKATVVQKDETEHGPRKLLNFGHTIGHAIEALSWETDNTLLHGEAVSIGMVAEAKISHAVGLLSEEETNTIQQTLQQIGLPISVQQVTREAILHKIASDKKISHGAVNWTLLASIGEAVYDQKVEEKIIYKAIEEVLYANNKN